MNWKDSKGNQISRWKSYKGTIEKRCLVCKDTFINFISNKRKYCSMKCYHKSPSRGTRPRNRLKKKCDFCGKMFERPVANFKNTKHFYCSMPCMGDWIAEYGPHGKDHHSWLGGYSQKEYSDGWTRIKKEVRKRANNKCEKCGGIHKFMDVHHKIPVRMKKDIKIMNHLDNLQFLCRLCHLEADFLLRGHPHQKA